MSRNNVLWYGHVLWCVQHSKRTMWITTAYKKNRVCMHLGTVHFRQATRRDLLRFQEWPARFRRLPAFQTRSSSDRVTERRQHPVKILATKLLVPSNYQLPRSAPRYLSVADTPPNVGNGEAPAWSVKPPGRAPSCAPSSDTPKRQIDMTQRRRRNGQSRD